MFAKKPAEDKCGGREILTEAGAREVITLRNKGLKDLFWCMRYCEHDHWHAVNKDDMKRSHRPCLLTR